MIRVMLIICCVLAVACSGDAADPHTHTDPDAGPADDVDASDSGNNDSSNGECVCDDTEDPCCDGCDAIDVGTECDDGLDCTVGTVCTDAGTCGDAAGTVCDDNVEHPECMAASCDEEDGCSYEPIRQDLDCDADGLQPGTGQCDDGQCIGEPCECDTDDECCDGCMGINDGSPCDGVDYGMQCDAGACVEAPCDCNDAGDPCCDGCYWTEGQRCGGGTSERTCFEYGVCGGEYEETVCDRFCLESDGYECSADTHECETATASCSSSSRCDDSTFPSIDECFYDDGCT